MSIKCVLGLTACLAYGGNEVPAEQVVAALDTCDLATMQVTEIRLEVTCPQS